MAAEPIKKIAQLTRDQKNNLEARISRISGYSHANTIASEKLGPESKEIAAMRAKVDRYDRQRSERERAIRKQIEVEARQTRERLLFGTSEEALAAVKALERKYGVAV